MTLNTHKTEISKKTQFINPEVERWTWGGVCIDLPLGKVDSNKLTP